MNYTDNALNIFTVKTYKGIGNAWVVKNLKGNETDYTIVTLLNRSIKGNPTSVEEFDGLKRKFEIELKEKLKHCIDGFVAKGDDNFPKFRGNVKESEQPILIYYKGNLDLLGYENKNISVIGLLNPDDDIENRERAVVDQFVQNGATIISGLALGCDSISHKQALDSNGKTVAILPSPLNNILPAKNNDLASEIVERGGLLITEYYDNCKSYMDLSSRYKERDRLQALFCDTIFLAASYAQNSSEREDNRHLKGKKLDSGARLAMSYAKDYNIPRAVMYDPMVDIANPMFDLNRDIINDSKDIVVINQENVNEGLSKLMQRISSLKHSANMQTDLFG
ncbi:DNA-processing protein DprA [Pedobacter sp. MC2016-24]|uniref:DNA-processing protein DprA n=1 Tax=Pedobacter sp. MC2016-24 TaxID=2780090 RepID=UPI00187DE7DD|nr:DNA-processing protein DprA [Pedobacter sp. MC2016-24]MBE9597990.1 DNA-processing protein DprA [Pedobacter sp. MC2016-24]